MGPALPRWKTHGGDAPIFAPHRRLKTKIKETVRNKYDITYADIVASLGPQLDLRGGEGTGGRGNGKAE